MTIICNIWMIRSSVWDVFINFLLIDTTDKSKISSDQKRFFIALGLYPLSFFANTPFKVRNIRFFLQNFLQKTFLAGTLWDLHLKPSYTSIKNCYLITLLKHMNHPFKITKLTHYRWNRMICQKHESLG